MAMGYTSGVFTLGGCAAASWPSNGKLPERVVDKLEECGKKGPVPLQSVSYDLTFTVHVTEDDEGARVDDVMLMGSTLHLHEVEACMTDALFGMQTPLEALALRQRKLSPDKAPAPESRAMLGQAQVALLFEAAAFIVVGYAAYTVVVHVLGDKHHTKPRPHPAKPATGEPPAPPLSAATAEPTAIAAPTATSVPTTTAVPKARRYPNQTCENEELDRLEKEMHQRCDATYAATCGGKVNKKELPLIPCSAIKRSIEQRHLCLKHRGLVQEKCFGGVPDTVHKKAIGETQGGIDRCEALKLINCSKSHPMAGL